MKKIIALFICALCSGIGYAFPQGAQQAPASGAGPASAEAAQKLGATGAGATGAKGAGGSTGQAGTPAPLAVPKVIGIAVFHPEPRQAENAASIGKDVRKVAYAGNTITFYVSGAKAFLKSKPSDQAKVVLYVNGIEMPGMTADWYSQVTTTQIQGGHLPELRDTEAISIQLLRNPVTQNSWDFLYRSAVNFTDSYFDVKNASIGWEHMSALDKGAGDNSLTIVFFNWWEFIAWSLLYVLIIALFIWLAWKTNVLKVNADGPYSLSNTQLLYWTMLVMGAFIYTLMLTDISMSFNTSILYMLGISLGTTGAAVAIDQNKINSQTAVPKASQHFFKDLLTDGNSYSIQRVQTFFWNLILGLYFIVYTVKNKTMPEFSTTMLLLAGFSSTAYLAGKVPENTQATVAAQAAQAQAAQQQPIQQQPVQQQPVQQQPVQQQPPANGGH